MKGVKVALTFIGGAAYASFLWLAATSPTESWRFALGLIPAIVCGGMLLVLIIFWLVDNWGNN